MRMEERQAGIVRLVNERGRVSFDEIQTCFPQVSGMTLRRDLETLDKRHELIRIHGGAKSISYVICQEENYVDRIVRNVAQKQQIVREAVAMLRPNMAVYIDSGTTALELCKILPDEQFLIYTHGLHCAMELSRLAKPEIHLVGGRLSRISLSIVGPNAVDCLDDINFDIVFLGAGGYCAKRGFTCLGEEESYLRKAIIRRAEKVVMLMDSGKIGNVASYTLANLADIDVLITDSGIDERSLQELRSYDIDVTICPKS